MDYKELVHKLVNELSYRVGIPNVKDKTHQSIMSEILSEWGEFDAKQRIFEFLTEAEPEKTPEDGEYKNTGGSGYVKAQDYDKWKENPKGEFQKFSKTPSGKYIPKAEDGDEEEEKKTGGVFDTPEMKEKIEAEEELLTKINKNELKEIDLKNTLNEASFLDPKYKPGHQIIVATPPPFAKELKKGDVLTIVTDKLGEPDYGDGEYEKTLQFPNGTEFKVASKNTGYASSYFTHLKSGKAMPAGEDWESLIIVAFNEIYEGSEWDRAEKFWADYGDDARKVAESFKKLIKSKSLSQLGSSTAALNSDWGGSNKTPKTDILGNSDERISLKKSGGSQLMSGGPEEALATFDAAIKTVGENKPKVLDSFLNTLEDKMGKMTQKGTITALQKLRDSGETLTKDQEAAIAEMEKLQLNAQEINKDMSSVFKDIYFKTAFCFEAATGTKKFSDKKAVANELIEFNPGNGKITAHLPMKKLGDAKVLAQSNSFYVSFKTGGGGSKPYLALRTKKMSKKAMLGEEVESFRDIVVEEFSKSDYGMSMLNEANEQQLNEFQIFNKLSKGLKNISSKIKSQAKKILEVILKRIKQAFDAIKRLGQQMFDGIMHFLGMEVSSVKISSGGAFPLV